MKNGGAPSLTIPEGDYASSVFDTSFHTERKHLVLIYSTPRSGSTLLCSMLHKAGICTPHEYFQPQHYRRILEERWGVAANDTPSYCRKLIEKRIGPSGVLGINLHAAHLDHWADAAPFLSDFERVSHLFLWRSQKTAQAVSFFVAHRTGKWSSAFGPVTSYPDYDGEEIRKRADILKSFEARLMKEASVLGEAAQHLTYEDLVNQPAPLQVLHPDLPKAQVQPGIKRQSGSVEFLYRRVFEATPNRSFLWSRAKKTKTRVTVFPLAKTNPYQNMMYSTAKNWLDVEFYRNLSGLKKRLRFSRSDDLLHIQWEEGILWSNKPMPRMLKQQKRFKALINHHKSRGGKVLWTLHNEVAHCRKDLAELATDLREFMTKKSDAVHVHSEAACEFALNRLSIPAENLIKVEHPSYVDIYDEFRIHKVRRKRGSARFLFFGRIENYKGILDLVEAFDCPKVVEVTERLTLAGKATDAVQEDLRSRLGHLGERVAFEIGFVAEARIPALLSETDFVILPYTQSLTSGVAALAMTYGKPIIARRLAGTVEAVPPENHQLFYDNPSELSQTLIDAANLDPESYQLIRNAACDWAVDKSQHRQSAKLLGSLINRGLIAMN